MFIQKMEDLEKQLDIIPTPTNIMKVGDKGKLGNVRDVVIEEVLFDGKGYLIDYTDYDHNYGRPIITQHRKRVVAWMDVRKPNDNKTSVIKNDDIFVRYSSTSITSIFGKVYSFGLDMNPEYQRGYVWTNKEKVSLLDSIFNNIEIGRFVFNFEGYGGDTMYTVVDGKQRINAIMEFYEDRLKYQGMYFSDMCYHDQGHFEQYNIMTAELEKLSREQILQVFIMLNTTGKVMTKEHLNKVKKLYKEAK